LGEIVVHYDHVYRIKKGLRCGIYSIIRAGLSIPEVLGKLSIGGPLPTYVEDQKKKKVITSNS